MTPVPLPALPVSESLDTAHLLPWLLQRRANRVGAITPNTPNVSEPVSVNDCEGTSPELLELISDAHRRLVQAQADLAYWASVATQAPAHLGVLELSRVVGMSPARLSTFLNSPHGKQAEQDVSRGLSALSAPSPRVMPATITHLFPSTEPIRTLPEHSSVVVNLSSGSWTITARAHEQATLLGLTPEAVAAMADDPAYTSPDSMGRAMEHCKGGYKALVPHNSPHVVIGVSEVREWGEDSTGPIRTPSAKSGGPGRRMPGNLRELTDALTAHGFRIDLNHPHPQATHPRHPGKVFVIPSTPSDYRSLRNLIAGLRRDFGIDITR